MVAVVIRQVTEKDNASWLRMRHALWPHAIISDLEAEIKNTRHQTQRCLVAEDSADHALLGFVEVSMRSVADGCDSSPVGYIEGLYVVDSARGKGIARLLVQKAEEWVRQRGCSEMASDAELHNQLSIDIHKKLGFEEVSRVVTLRKSL